MIPFSKPCPPLPARITRSHSGSRLKAPAHGIFYWNGTQILNLSGSGPGVYTLYNFIEPATTSSTTLEFQGYNTNSTPDFVDNVSASEVDEPSASLLLSIGLGLLCVRLLRA